jgi:hypothetical protein
MPTPEETAAAEAAKAATPKFVSQLSKETAAQYAEELKGYAGKDVNELFIEHASLSRKVKERGIIVPTKDSPPEEIAEFHTRMDLPTKPEEYDLKADEKLIPKPVIEETRQFVYANGLTRKQAQAHMSRLEAIARAAAGSAETRKAQAEANKMPALTAAMNVDAKAAEAAYNLAVKNMAGLSEETRKVLLDSGVAYHPAFLKDMAGLQAKFEPHGFVAGEGGAVGGGAQGAKPAGRQGNYSEEWNRLHPAAKAG